MRPVSAYVVGDKSKNSADEKPVLRRERTFDMDPKPSTSSTKLVEVNIDAQDPDESRDQHDEPTLQMFQQQRLYHTMRLKREIAKLEKMEKEIAQKASEIGPEPKPRQCWTQTSNPSSRPSSSSSSIRNIHNLRQKLCSFLLQRMFVVEDWYFLDNSILLNRYDTIVLKMHSLCKKMFFTVFCHFSENSVKWQLQNKNRYFSKITQ